MLLGGRGGCALRLILVLLAPSAVVIARMSVVHPRIAVGAMVSR